MRKTSQKEIDAVVRLDGPARFEHFVKRVVDEERAWGLWKDGWALMAASDGEQVFPLWPAREYAEACRVEDWSAYEPEEIPLRRLLDELLPKLKDDRVRPGVFPTPHGKGVTPTVDELQAALREELERYE
jgi:hypothetical protein